MDITTCAHCHRPITQEQNHWTHTTHPKTINCQLFASPTDRRQLGNTHYKLMET